jgi:hypothetical protein
LCLCVETVRYKLFMTDKIDSAAAGEPEITIIPKAAAVMTRGDAKSASSQDADSSVASASASTTAASVGGSAGSAGSAGRAGAGASAGTASFPFAAGSVTFATMQALVLLAAEGYAALPPLTALGGALKNQELSVDASLFESAAAQQLLASLDFEFAQEQGEFVRASAPLMPAEEKALDEAATSIVRPAKSRTAAKSAAPGKAASASAPAAVSGSAACGSAFSSSGSASASSAAAAASVAAPKLAAAVGAGVPATPAETTTPLKKSVRC